MYFRGKSLYFHSVLPILPSLKFLLHQCCLNTVDSALSLRSRHGNGMTVVCVCACADSRSCATQVGRRGRGGGLRKRVYHQSGTRWQFSFTSHLVHHHACHHCSVFVMSNECLAYTFFLRETELCLRSVLCPHTQSSKAHIITSPVVVTQR